MPIKWVRDFLQKESAGGLILIGAALFALILDHSPFAAGYHKVLHTPFVSSLTVTSFVNDGLMTLFFVLVGLELKREFVVGELAHPSNVILPLVAAAGGMLVPALIYTALNYHDAIQMRGWAVPVATDIAFALGVLSLLGKRIPVELKLFLMTLAIFDDVGAIVIIAALHSDSLSALPALFAVICLFLLGMLNILRVQRRAVYILLGLCLWAAVLRSGVHATVAGVLFAFMIPMPMLPRMEARLHFWVAYFILPLFALVNAGVSLQGDLMPALLHPVTLGIVLGLFVGKQLGVFGFTWVWVKLGWAKLSSEITWHRLYGMSVLCGIGFTMSLFIGTLAFERNSPANLTSVRLGVLLGSFLSGVVGLIILSRKDDRKNRG